MPVLCDASLWTRWCCPRRRRPADFKLRCQVLALTRASAQQQHRQPPRQVRSAPKQPADAGRQSADSKQGGLQRTGVRINKCFREFASRREADSFVSDGRVTVNGVRANSGAQVYPGDTVCLDSKPVAWETLQFDLAAAEEGGDLLPLERRVCVSCACRESQSADSHQQHLRSQFCYFKYYKPVGITCTLDTRIAGNLVDALGNRVTGRAFSVGRLDRDSSGLLLITSDGRVPNAVLRRVFGHEKEDAILTESRVSDADIRQLSLGVVITTVAQRDGRHAEPLTAKTKPCKVVRGSQRLELRMTLTEGRNRQIRKMLGALGYTVVQLHRVRFMSVQLEDMKPDELRRLSEAEMLDIRQAVRTDLAGRSCDDTAEAHE